MVRYWCGECNSEHDNARECPHYSRVGKSYEKGQKVANNFKKRSKMKDNNYQDPDNSPKDLTDDCLPTLVIYIVLPVSLLIWGAVEWIS